MNALEMARQFTEEADYRGLSKYEVELALAYASVAQAEALERIAMHLGNIHQTLISPNKEREPYSVADLLKCIAVALVKDGKGDES
jgi:hypothetical protein